MTENEQAQKLYSAVLEKVGEWADMPIGAQAGIVVLLDSILTDTRATPELRNAAKQTCLLLAAISAVRIGLGEGSLRVSSVTAIPIPRPGSARN